jgi:hypothetical protein
MRLPTLTIALPIIVGCATPAFAQTGVNAVVMVELRALRSDGVAARNAGISRVTKPGDVATTYVHAGRREDPEGTLCSMRAATATPQLTERDKQAFAGAAYLWKITTTALAFEAGRLTLDVDWQRFDRGSEAPTLSGKQRVILEQGGRGYPLDLVRGSLPTCPAALLEVTAGVREDPAFADSVLRYDVWLVRQDRNGKKETRQVILSSVHGGEANFQFAPLFSTVPTLQPEQYDFRVATRVKGTILGRLSHDGSVAIELETHRSDDIERPGQDATTTPPRIFGGRKTLSGTLGQAIEVQLPPGNGYTSTYVSAKAEAAAKEARENAAPLGVRAGEGKIDRNEPIAVRNGRLAINYGPFLEGERLSLIVQVRKAEGAEAEPLAKR